MAPSGRAEAGATHHGSVSSGDAARADCADCETPRPGTLPCERGMAGDCVMTIGCVTAATESVVTVVERLVRGDREFPASAARPLSVSLSPDTPPPRV